MNGRPFHHETERARRKAPLDDSLIVDGNDRLVGAIPRMEMGRGMVVVEHE